MIIYNVTVSIHPEIEKEALVWFKEEHIPEVMSTNLFMKFEMYKVIENPADRSHNSYAFQYHLESWKKFEEYQARHAPALKEKTEKKFGENVLTFRTFLEKI
ncbi:MAG: hypothetical protein COA58_07635 [Bacteroidetes bacterium]|nr:MAG: hypothetical protein COA58_07635 [Bacteroidota bacterium]